MGIRKRRQCLSCAAQGFVLLARRSCRSCRWKNYSKWLSLPPRQIPCPRAQEVKTRGRAGFRLPLPRGWVPLGRHNLQRLSWWPDRNSGPWIKSQEGHLCLLQFHPDICRLHTSFLSHRELICLWRLQPVLCPCFLPDDVTLPCLIHNLLLGSSSLKGRLSMGRWWCL